MIANPLFQRYVAPCYEYLAHNRSLPTLCYCGVIIALLMIVFVTVTGALEHQQAVGESARVLARLEQRAASLGVQHTNVPGAQDPPGSPFLDGRTVTLASAALLQRVIQVITESGGRVVSSEVAPQTSQAADHFVRVTATCEVDQTKLQDVLYDIEAGMPFLFVDELTAEGQAAGSGSSRMHIVIQVSGLWPGAEAR
jgi:general secretion pathway protein M